MDTQQQHAANAMAGMGFGIILFACLITLAIGAFYIYLHWRIFTKAGMAGPLALLIIVPFGALIVPCILAFGEWKVAPVGPQYGGLPPTYPPPPPAPNFPPSSYSSQNPTV